MIEVAIRIDAPGWRRRLPDATRILRRAANAALAGARAAPPLELTIVLSDDSRVRALNRDWRGEDAATNVLAFPAGPAPPGPPRLLGDVVLALGTCAREARAQGKTLAAHATHLVVHGVLHLLGHDHDRDRTASRMEALERRVLAGLGLDDPYAPRPRRRAA